MLQFHMENDALATLAVKDRRNSRPLLFDKELQLCGRGAGGGRKREIIRPCSKPQSLAFSGIHVISPRMLPMMAGEGAFSIVSTYLDLAARGEKILAFRAGDYYWRDLGTPQNVRQAVEDAEQNVIL
jgi:NDP-sugar pyrophosphorylase family protein